MSRWKRRVMESTGVTEYPPGPHLDRYGKQKVYVTGSGFDDIGEVLSSMGVEFEPFDGSFDCSLLFLNCGTSDTIDTLQLAEFVREGGCVYASDRADTYIAEAFPGVFEFGGRTGRSGQVSANVIDPELKSVLGDQIDIEFDMGAWATLRNGTAESLITSAEGSQLAGQPLMAYAEYGNGAIFFTSFHNKVQTSDSEKHLLQLLVVKQFSAKSHASFEQVSKSMGLALDQIRTDLRQ